MHSDLRKTLCPFDHPVLVEYSTRCELLKGQTQNCRVREVLELKMSVSRSPSPSNPAKEEYRDLFLDVHTPWDVKCGRATSVRGTKDYRFSINIRTAARESPEFAMYFEDKNGITLDEHIQDVAGYMYQNSNPHSRYFSLL